MDFILFSANVDSDKTKIEVDLQIEFDKIIEQNQGIYFVKAGHISLRTGKSLKTIINYVLSESRIFPI